MAKQFSQVDSLDGCRDRTDDESALGNIDGFVVEKAIPEPSVIALFALGLLGLGFARRIRS